MQSQVHVVARQLVVTLLISDGDHPAEGDRISRATMRGREQQLATRGVILALDVLRQLALFAKVCVD